MPQTKVKKVVAGPGAGKTCGLIKEVLSQIGLLKPNKYFVVITYTNAATEKIRKQLENKIKMPPNFFMGTIHSFLDRFVLVPHASKLGIIPQNITFIDDIDVSDKRFKNIAVKNARDKGIITYEQIEKISEKIICGGRIKSGVSEIFITSKIAKNHANIISKRIQQIFVDEYQDASISQHRIFIKLISTGFIEYFYCVGDPEQYIYSFTYKDKPKKPKFNEIPIHKIDLVKGIKIDKNNVNRRSNCKITQFINNFSSLKQTNTSVLIDDLPRVFFIPILEQKKIIEAFSSICDRYKLVNESKFFLSFSKKTINHPNLTDIEQVVDPSLKSEKLLFETVHLICAVTGYSQKELLAIKNWSEIDLRKVALKVLKMIKTVNKISEKEIRSLLKAEFGISGKIDNRYKYKNTDSLNKILLILKDLECSSDNVHSTIHKSKGLEANAVLVIAKTKEELKKWLEVDPKKRAEDKNDICRIGFVAFSRAKDLLCIACLEDIGEMHSNILSLGITVYSNVLESLAEKMQEEFQAEINI